MNPDLPDGMPRIETLIPAPDSSGEWHSAPADDEQQHSMRNCDCDPQLQVSTKDGKLLSVWVHRKRSH